ncbi:hypothetical protein Bca101_043321 [Brassica carinata]
MPSRTKGEDDVGIIWSARQPRINYQEVLSRNDVKFIVGAKFSGGLISLVLVKYRKGQGKLQRLDTY